MGPLPFSSLPPSQVGLFVFHLTRNPRRSENSEVLSHRMRPRARPGGRQSVPRVPVGKAGPAPSRDGLRVRAHPCGPAAPGSGEGRARGSGPPAASVTGPQSPAAGLVLLPDTGCVGIFPVGRLKQTGLKSPLATLKSWPSAALPSGTAVIALPFPRLLYHFMCPQPGGREACVSLPPCKVSHCQHHANATCCRPAI